MFLFVIITGVEYDKKNNVQIQKYRNKNIFFYRFVRLTKYSDANFKLKIL